MAGVVVIDYTNHRGERRNRTIIPLRMFFGTSEYHEELQWLLDAIDLDLVYEGRESGRTFAMKDVHSWIPKTYTTAAPDSEPHTGHRPDA